MFLARGMRLAKYRSNGIINVCVSSRKCRRISADWTALGLLSWTPFCTRFTIALSLSKRALVDEYRPALASNLNLVMAFCLLSLPDFEGDFCNSPLSVPESPNLTIFGQCLRALPKKGFVTPRTKKRRIIFSNWTSTEYAIKDCS